MAGMPGINPFGLWLAGIHTAHAALEAQTAIAMRLMGYATALHAPGAGLRRLWTETPGAMVASGGAAAMAVLEGRAPEKIMEAALEPLCSRQPAGSGHQT